MRRADPVRRPGDGQPVRKTAGRLERTEVCVTTAFNVLLVVIGFGFVIFFHELGHFLAARWAGIRVLAFTVGFGPALVSFRKGLGFRVGSSEAEVEAIRKRELEGIQQAGVNTANISYTEYRLNVLPFGGYVRMLGQEDANPGAVSSAPDSFTSKPVWKRMVVVSAGVVMNIILAGAIFVGVFLHGIDEPPAMVGGVQAGSPAEKGGMRMGDVVTSVDGRSASSFMDLQIGAALAGPGKPVPVVVARADGSSATLEVTPVEDPATRMRMIGVEPSVGTQVFQPRPNDTTSLANLRELLDRATLGSVRPGMTMTEINGVPIPARTVWRDVAIPSAATLIETVRCGDGAPVELTFTDAQGTEVVEVEPDPEFESARIEIEGAEWPVEHLLGVMPVMGVGSVQKDSGADRAGLKAGDVIAQVGRRTWPSTGEGIAEIRSRKNATIDLTVIRDGAFVPIKADVGADGRIGFSTEAAWSMPIVAQTPKFIGVEESSLPVHRMAFGLVPGTRIDGVEGRPVASFADIRRAIRDATTGALASHEGATIHLDVTVLDPGSLTTGKPEKTELVLNAEDVARVHGLSWNIRPVLAVLEFAMFPYKASGPVDALMLGAAKTTRYMQMTYVTLQRLFQNTVKVEHLKGPVGIADVGSQVAERGIIHLLFFLGVISVNLAVVNFLPLPIVDGGLFLMLVYEGVVRKPVPMVVQNALTVVGLVLIGSMFLIVTFNDIRALF